MAARSTSSTYYKYPSTCTFDGRHVLNLGCGFSKYAARNVVNLDCEPCSGADVIWDLSKTPLPFQDETFDFIIANHVMEHVPNWWACFEDCARILKTGGTMEIWVPGSGSDAVFGYRDHLQMINQCSFWGTWGLTRCAANAWAAAHSDGRASLMKFVRQDFHLDDHWWIRYAPLSLKRWMGNHLRNVIFEEGFTFQKMPSEAKIVPLNPATVEAAI